MLYVYTIKDVCKKKVIEDVEAFFKYNYIEILKHKDSVIDVLLKIDGSKFIVDDIIQTPFGRTGLYDISTGCKAAIISILYPDFCTSYMEVGHNVFDYIVMLSKQKDIFVYTPILLFAKGLTTKIYINDKESTVKDLMLKMSIW